LCAAVEDIEKLSEKREGRPAVRKTLKDWRANVIVKSTIRDLEKVGKQGREDQCGSING